jgi:hypothetical protein
MISPTPESSAERLAQGPTPHPPPGTPPQPPPNPDRPPPVEEPPMPVPVPPVEPPPQPVNDPPGPVLRVGRVWASEIRPDSFNRVIGLPIF